MTLPLLSPRAVPERALEILARHQDGFSLERSLHLDPETFAWELGQIWRTSWLFAGHSADLPRAGERMVFDVGNDSVVIVRGDDGRSRAFHNICRHRGTRLVDGPSSATAIGPGADGDGAVKATGAETSTGFIRCPYHQWAYRLDGSLAACGGMDRAEGLDPAQYGLVALECEEVGGLIFIRMTDSGQGGAQTAGDSRGLAGRITELAAPLAPQGLERAKVAHVEHYLVNAGWKVVWENNRECWHCHVGHPEYIRSHYDTANVALPEVRATIATRTEAMMAAVGGLAASDVYDGGGLALFPSPGRSWSSHRTPLMDGFLSESLDGSALGPLMGDYQSYGVGVLRLRSLPNFWCHASADHAVTTRLAPAGLEQTEVVVTWLVDEGAVEGRDYSLATLLPVWARTSEQDWQLCERNQRGIRSPAYQPGPLSTRQEANVAAFHSWYRDAMLAPT